METALRGIKAVFFDLDDTLYDQMQPFRDAVHHTLPQLEMEESAAETLFRRVRHYSDRLWDKYKAGELSLEDVRIQRLTLAFDELGLGLDNEQASLLQRDYEHRQQHISLSNGAAELIGALQQKGIDTGIMTNGPYGHQWGKIRALGLDLMIPEDRIFVSDALGIAKPDPEVFHHISRIIGQPPANCLYIGDAWVNDVTASTAAGWRAIWLNRRGGNPEDAIHKPVRIVGDLRELII
ncbi:HAD family hydrolase [Paenibacillus sepulcri]|uniref:HAD family hydrolase n=1 Tax=Paenibacillus sepulcri TaxID=359917 RepID=A0ABS7C6I8_9BACL|nr:HAD family hydrolase [Paenibacillus sepulcri]